MSRIFLDPGGIVESSTTKIVRAELSCKYSVSFLIQKPNESNKHVKATKNPSCVLNVPHVVLT